MGLSESALRQSRSYRNSTEIKYDMQCTYNGIRWRIRLYIFSIETQQCVLRVCLSCLSLNNIKMSSVVQQFFCGKIATYVAGNHEPYLGLHVVCPIFLSDFDLLDPFS
jgi:hypothetical protein